MNNQLRQMKSRNCIITAMHEVNSLKSEGYHVRAQFYDRHDDFYLVILRHANGNKIKVRATSICGQVIKNGVVIKDFL